MNAKKPLKLLDRAAEHTFGKLQGTHTVKVVSVLEASLEQLRAHRWSDWKGRQLSPGTQHIGPRNSLQLATARSPRDALAMHNYPSFPPTRHSQSQSRKSKSEFSSWTRSPARHGDDCAHDGQVTADDQTCPKPALWVRLITKFDWRSPWHFRRETC